MAILEALAASRGFLHLKTIIFIDIFVSAARH
jgi:hypothetical protein